MNVYLCVHEKDWENKGQKGREITYTPRRWLQDRMFQNKSYGEIISDIGARDLIKEVITAEKNKTS